mgnify:CR=1 FL=1
MGDATLIVTLRDASVDRRLLLRALPLLVLFSILVGWFGGGMHVAPDANLADGALSVVRFGDLARSDFVLSLPKLYRGTHYAHPKVTHARGRVIEATPHSRMNTPIDVRYSGPKDCRCASPLIQVSTTSSASVSAAKPKNQRRRDRK